MKENKPSIDKYTKAIAGVVNRMQLPVGMPQYLDVKSGRELLREINATRGEERVALDVKYPGKEQWYEGFADYPEGETKDAVAYFEYMDKIYSDLEYNRKDITWQDREARVQVLEKEFIQKFGEDQYTKVQVAQLVGKGLPPEYIEYKLAQDDIAKSGYWDLTGEEQQQLRTQNPLLDAKLFTWGYVWSLQSQDGADIASNMLRDLEFKRDVPAAYNSMMRQAQLDSLDASIKSAAATGRLPFDVKIRELEDAYYKTVSAIYNYDKMIKITQVYDKQKQYIEARDNEIEILKAYMNLLPAFDRSHPKVRVLELKLQKDIFRYSNR